MSPLNLMKSGATEQPPESIVTSFLDRYATVLCAVLLAFMALQMFAVISRKNITVDERVMIPSGYYHLTAGDYRPINQHPPLAKVLGAAPLLLTKTEAAPITVQTDGDPFFLFLLQNFWATNTARIDHISFWARVPMIAITVLLGVLIFVYARRYWGPRAALFAVGLFTLEPTVLAHGRVVQTDVLSALALLIFSFTFYEYLTAPSAKRAVYVGLATGMAAVTKFSMVAIVPVLALVFAALIVFAPRLNLVRRAKGGAGASQPFGPANSSRVIIGHAGALLVAAIVTINLAYLFHRGTPEPLDLTLARLSFDGHVGQRLHRVLDLGYHALHVIFPADFVTGFCKQLAHARGGHRAGLLGQYSSLGWWYYFPVAFALKTSLPILLSSVGAFVWAVMRLRRKLEGRLLVLVVPIVLFTGMLMLSRINIGVRYYLPAYPFFVILAGAFMDHLLRRAARPALALAPIALVFGWAGFEAARAHPDQMTYMNQLAGTRPTWWYLSDSNIEWGDDIRQLAAYLHERGETKVGAEVLNNALLEIYGLQRVDIFIPPGESREETRYVAVGASFLNGSNVRNNFRNGVRLSEAQRVNFFDEYRLRSPEKIFGGSIYLYRVKE